MNVARITRTYCNSEWPFRKYVPKAYPDRDLEGYLPHFWLIPEFTLNEHRVTPIFNLCIDQPGYMPMLG